MNHLKIFCRSNFICKYLYVHLLRMICSLIIIPKKCCPNQISTNAIVFLGLLIFGSFIYFDVNNICVLFLFYSGQFAMV